MFIDYPIAVTFTSCTSDFQGPDNMITHFQLGDVTDAFEAQDRTRYDNWHWYSFDQSGCGANDHSFLMENGNPVSSSLVSFNKGTAGNDSEHRFYTLTFPSDLVLSDAGEYHFVFTETD